MRLSSVLAGLGMLALVGSACVGQDNGGAIDTQGTAPLRDGVTTTAPTAAGGTVKLSAALSGEGEVPGPGDPAAKGTAALTVAADGQICGTIDVGGLASPNAAHIHTGAAGVAGPVLITLKTPTGGKSDGCVAATPAQVTQILASPAGFYVNVHTAAHPNGAVRGQLAAL